MLCWASSMMCLIFQKSKQGKLELEERVFDLRESLGDTIGSFAPRAHGKNLELAYRVDPHVPRFVVGDAGRLRQVMNNLIGNAVKFTHKGEVLVHVSDLPSTQGEVRLEISVRDTGIGIPAREAFCDLWGIRAGRYIHHSPLWRHRIGTVDIFKARQTHGWDKSNSPASLIREVIFTSSCHSNGRLKELSSSRNAVSLSWVGRASWSLTTTKQIS